MKKAKIIVLSGQSNAVGVGHKKCLGRSFSEEKIKEFLEGYENVRIRYYSHDKKNDSFEKTTTNCTELHKDTIGPELGIADYLNEKYPDEEFYIVKFAIGGASLKRDFLPPSSGGYYDVKEFKNEYEGFIDAFFNGKPLKNGWCFNGLADLIKDSISYLEGKGLSPEIIGFCWMQGESDAGKLENVNGYEERFDNFVKDLKKEFPEYLKDCIFVDAGISEVWKFYREMNAFKKEYAEKNGCHFGFDFHSPWHIGDQNDTVFIVQNRTEKLDKLNRFGEIFEESITEKSLKYEHKNDNTTRLTITIHEGRNRQVRKMCAAVGHEVISLKRVAVGDVILGNLPLGKWRHLNPVEINKLLK